MKKFLILLCTLTCLLSGCVPGEGEKTVTPAPFVGENAVFVSPDGRDDADGSYGAPVATLARALELAGPGTTVYLAGGTYYGRTELISGEADAPVVITSLPGERARLSAAVAYTGEWTRWKDNVYRADLSAMADRIDWTRPQLFCDGEALTEARWPNVGPDRTVLTAERAVAAQGTDATHIAASETLPALDAGARVVVWPGPEGMSGWDQASALVESVDGAVLTLKSPIADADDYTGARAAVEGNAFFLVGSLSLLDAPGEYYLDRESRTAYCCLPDGGDPTEHETAFRAGSYALYGQGVDYVTIRDVDVFGGGVCLRDATHCVVTGCRLTYGDHASYLEQSAYAMETANTVTGRFNRVEDCEIAFSAFSGLTVGGSDTVIAQNHIHDVDLVGSNFAGIFVRGGAERLTLEYNAVRRVGRFGLYFMASSTYADCLVKGNYIAEFGCLTSDCGAFYTWNAVGGGTTLCDNFVSCTTLNVNGAHRKGLSGLYLDNYCTGFSVHHNLIVGRPETEAAGLRINLTAAGTVCANNTVSGCTIGLGIYGYPQDEADAAGVTFANNLFGGVSAPVSYYASEQGEAVSYNGDFIDGCVPVPYRTEGRMGGGNNLVLSALATGWRPSVRSAAIDGGREIPGVTEGFQGDAPDIGALEYGTPAFVYGPKDFTP
ncbi:MAG: right-handed parallel beta-helix repeat-containing protein [Eubacteriales bacterium]|nr:right-handed parallel beta-helix repeat-containing protein [Eubacteriales bacterium]